MLDKKAMVNFKIYGVSNWEANYYDTYIAQYLKKMKFLKLIRKSENDMIKIYLEKSYTECGGVTSPGFFSRQSKLSRSLDQQSEKLYSLSLLHIQAWNYNTNRNNT